ncbi:hypothetical protein ACL02T_32525 [Pseudonocardia sp. RS010]|uniref:hypothetical protein n=1 Tax=Pseudonocardia sp. RS010 TaxID=3385979 RepID=UPI0039A1E28F
MGRHALGTPAEKATALGWQEHPSTYVLTLQDKQFSVALQRGFASYASRTVEVDAGHGGRARGDHRRGRKAVGAAGAPHSSRGSMVRGIARCGRRAKDQRGRP